jgi:DNA-directed RNA polymerase specialized sigma24 family protein
VVAIRGGLVDDESGFHDFVAARLARLSRVAYLLTGSHHAAEDLVQAVLIKVARQWPRVTRLDQPDTAVRRARLARGKDRTVVRRGRRRHIRCSAVF